MNRFPGLATPPRARSKWSIRLKLAAFPLIPVIGLMAIGISVLIDVANSEPQMINGRPDNAPFHAAAIIVYAVPRIYLVYLAALGLARVSLCGIRRLFRKTV